MKKWVLVLLLALAPFIVKAQENEGPLSGDNCGNNCHWQIENGVLTITGYGDIADFPRDCNGGCHNTAPWAASAQKIQKVIIQNEPDSIGFKSVGEGAFAVMYNLKKAILPEGLEKIKAQAFINDINLTSANLPSTLTSIGSEVFNDTSLTSLEIPKGITELKSSVFGNINISSVVIPENVMSITQTAFTISTGASSTPLETIYCPEHLLSQCEQAVSFRTDAGLKTDILSYQKDGNRIFYNKRWYNSANDILFGDYIPKRIYTIDEANRVAGKANRVSIKYK